MIKSARRVSVHHQQHSSCLFCVATGLILQQCCFLVAYASLTFHPFVDDNDFAAPCADGSAFGVYVEDNPRIPLSESRNHVLVFMGGGACAGPDDCLVDYHDRPFVFSTHYNPITVDGNTILSSNSTINSIMHSYTKWLIPYCSQDFFLGNNIGKGPIGGNFTHMGATHFRQAMAYWRDQVLKARTSSPYQQKDNAKFQLLDNVVVVGISAGGVGLMNHIPTVRAAANQVTTGSIHFILDAPTVVSDRFYVGKDFNRAVKYYNVDINHEFPLCDPSRPASEMYFSTGVSVLPCCLSTHCLFRHDIEGLASFVLDPQYNNHNGSGTAIATERLLVLDSAYDPVALLGGTKFLQHNQHHLDGTSLPFFLDDGGATVDGVWNAMESAGGRKARARETAAAAKALARQYDSVQQQQNIDNQQLTPPFTHSASISTNTAAPSGNRVQWLMTACLGHSFIVPTVDFLFLACRYANYKFDHFDIVCSPDGQATQYSTAINVVIRLWRTTHTLSDVRFLGHSLDEIIQGFVNSSSSSPLTSSLPQAADGSSSFGVGKGGTRNIDDNQVIDLLFESCSGPNCLPGEYDGAMQPSCQKLIEIENIFVPVPLAFQITWLVALASLVVFSLVLRYNAKKDIMTTLEKQSEKQEGASKNVGEEKKSKTTLRLCGIRVRTRNGRQTLLHAVTIDLKACTIIGVTGRSGSGKSTLLKALGRNSQPGLSVSIDHGERRLKQMTKAYLCQEDPVFTFGELYPCDYILTTANVYNAQINNLRDLYEFTRELFYRGDECLHGVEEQRLNPFFETKIKHCSGGQRRILSIAATLLREPQILLLDEPLSGLDSVSGLQVMSALKSLTALRRCATLMTVHTPSTEVLSQFDQILVLDAGRVALNERITDPERTAQMIEARLVRSHVNSSRFSLSQGSRRSLLLSSGGASGASDPSTDLDSEILSMTQLVRSSSSGYVQNRNRRLINQQLQGVRGRAGEGMIDNEEPLSSRTNAGDGKRHPQRTHPDKCKSSVEGAAERVLIHFPLYLRQVGPLAQRIHLQDGFAFMDGITVILALCVGAGMLVVYDGSHMQVVLASACIVAVPTFLFTHKIFMYNELWRSHKYEMDDKRISPLSFQMATALFTYPMPLLSLFVAIAIAYSILGWSYNTFLVQCLFAGVYLLVALQFGRVLSISFEGKFGTVMKVYTTVLLINAVFSSLFVASHRYPPQLQFLFVLSMNFWSLSGAVLTIFNDDHYSSSRSCYDFVSCLVSNGNIVGRVLGFAPLSNGFRALGVLTAVFVGLVIVETTLLFLRCDSLPQCRMQTSKRPSSTIRIATDQATESEINV